MSSKFYEREAIIVETRDPYHAASLEAQGFKEVTAPAPAEAKVEGAKPVSKMTVAELTEYAKAEGIDLGEATKKADILAVIEGGKPADSDDKTEGADGDELLGESEESDDDPL